MTVDSDRTTALGVLRIALEYLACGVAAQEALSNSRGNAGMPIAPVQHLCGQSIELFLKAHLLQQGIQTAALKKLGHKLGVLLKKCETLGFAHDANAAHLSTLDEEYSGTSYRFRYIQTGVIRLLRPDELFLLSSHVAQPVAESVSDGWRFLVGNRVGALLVKRGWLDLIAARDPKRRRDRATIIGQRRDAAANRLTKLAAAKSVPDTRLLEPQ